MDEQIAKMAKIIDERMERAKGYLGSMNKGVGYWIAEDLVKYYVPKDVIEQLIKCLADNKEYDYESISYKDWCVSHVVIKQIATRFGIDISKLNDKPIEKLPTFNGVEIKFSAKE